jgi:glutamine--tRNA ligase
MRPFLNPDSIRVNKQAFVEKFVQTLPALSYLQFTRTGYYNIDPESTPEHLVFNSTVSLKEDKHK